MSRGSALPCLPLLLWKTPPGLEMILRQEGVPFIAVATPSASVMSSGRFVLTDRRRLDGVESAWLTTRHTIIDLDELIRAIPRRAFESLIDHRSRPMRWSHAGVDLVEKVAATPRAELRRAVLDALRSLLNERGGVWARLAAFPRPYRSAFNLRVDLDEDEPADYFAFARARRPIDDCTTHFISTRAYANRPEVLDDLRRLDAQSHGHHHFIYRDAEANVRNLAKADALLRAAGFDPCGFAAPHGRWNEGLDLAIEDQGYFYSSDFSIGYDDLPFHPWRGDGFSQVLQIPIHPVCEGLFFDAGAGDGSIPAEYFAGVVRDRLGRREPAFVYGHPERRLGRHPVIVAAIAEAASEFPLAWRVTMTQFARWWRHRLRARWSLVALEDGRYEAIFDHPVGAWPLAIEIVRDSHAAQVPVVAPVACFSLNALAYERMSDGSPQTPTPARRARGLKAFVRESLDWETVTPVDEIPTGSIAGRIKKELRRRRDRVA